MFKVTLAVFPMVKTTHHATFGYIYCLPVTLLLYLPGGKILYLKISVQPVVLKKKILNTGSLMSTFRSKVPPPIQKFPQSV